MALERADITIYIYTGLISDFTDTDLKYQISKQRISNRDNIAIEISELVKDYIPTTFNNDYISQIVWVRVVTNLIDSDTLLEFEYGSPVVNTYLAVEGFGTFEDGINPDTAQKALITTNTLYIPEGQTFKLPVFAENVGKVTINTTDTEITDNGNTNQKIQYLDVASDSSIVRVYDTDDTTVNKTLEVIEVCEPKYTPYKVTFINKHGAYQDLFFFKKTTESFTVTDETHKRNIIDTENLTYNNYEGQIQRYNVNAKTQLTLNTGYIKEDFNSAIEELFLSENVWINYGGNILPIIPTTKNMTYKTVLNNRLIDYTVNFDFAFNKINNVK